jgi:nitrite reductase/ring-hydroxylating ferredoxin subunit
VAWHVAARASDLEEGGVLGIKVSGAAIALYRIDDKLYATSDICTHGLALLSEGYLEGDCIECPLHQGLFHIPSGEVRSPPAVAPIATYPVKQEADNILVELPD